MSILTTLATFIYQQVVSYTDMNTFNTNFSTIDTGYGCKVYDASTQSIAHNTQTALEFDSENFDDDTLHDTSTNNSRITIAEAGRYLIIGYASWVTNSATGIKEISIRKNGTALVYDRNTSPSSSQNEYQQCSIIVTLAAEDYIELYAFQTSTAAASVQNHTLSVTKFI